MDKINLEIRNKGAIYGVGLGFILLVLGLFLYYYKTKLTESFFMIAVGGDYILWLLRLLIAALFCFNLRKKIGGYWTVRQATTGIFIMFIVAYAIQLMGRDVLFEKVIDQNAVINTRNAFKAANLKIFKEDADSKFFKEREKKIDERYPIQQKDVSIPNIMMTFLTDIILMFAVSLIFASLFKRDPLPQSGRS
jgi:Ca2+/H+ antiporter